MSEAIFLFIFGVGPLMGMFYHEIKQYFSKRFFSVFGIVLVFFLVWATWYDQVTFVPGKWHWTRPSILESFLSACFETGLILFLFSLFFGVGLVLGIVGEYFHRHYVQIAKKSRK